MTIEEKIREIMLSEELPDSEKLDRLHALIPTNVFKIDKLHKGRLRSSGSRTKDLRSPMQFSISGDGVMSADPLEAFKTAVEAGEVTGFKDGGMRSHRGS